jgi:phosphoglycerate dehydrogenase-like enzyme
MTKIVIVDPDPVAARAHFGELDGLASRVEAVATPTDADALVEALEGATVCVSSSAQPRLRADDLGRLPALRLIITTRDGVRDLDLVALAGAGVQVMAGAYRRAEEGYYQEAGVDVRDWLRARDWHQP